MKDNPNNNNSDMDGVRKPSDDPTGLVYGTYQAAYTAQAHPGNPS